jgi:drug/metabolite transporter (DMT)-like permease
LLALLRAREGSIRVPRQDAVRLLGLGAVGFGVYQIFWSTALRSIPAGDSALLVTATPVLTALLAVAAGSDLLTKPKLVGAIVSFLGVAVVIAGGPGLSIGASLAGDGLTLLAAGCFALYTAFGAAMLARHSPLRTTTWAVIGGCIVMAPIGLGQAATTDWTAVSVAAWLGFLYSAVFPAALSNVVVFRAIRVLGPTRISAYQFLVPFFALVLGALFLSEPIGLGQLAGGAVIVLGVVLARTSTSRLRRVLGIVSAG